MSDQTQRISNLINYSYNLVPTAQIHSAKPELRFCIGSNPARKVSKIRDGEDLWQWSQLEIRLNPFHRSTIQQKKFTKTIQNWIFARQRTWDKNYSIVIIFHIDCAQKNQVTKFKKFKNVLFWGPFYPNRSCVKCQFLAHKIM